MENLLRKKIADKARPIGIFADTGSADVVECIGKAGFDYVIIDNEHSPVEAETSAELIRASELCGMTPLCRVREISRPAVLKLLDVGAKGLIVPNVKTVEEVRDLVSYSKYSPVGNRGFAPSRKDGWGCDINMNVADTMKYHNEQVMLIPQCETVEALGCVEEIAGTEGVDGIFIGPFDLSISMGMPGDFQNPVFKAALRRIIEACHAAGKFCILFAGTKDAAVEGFGMGADVIAYSLDAVVIIEGFKERLAAIRAEL